MAKIKFYKKDEVIASEGERPKGFFELVDGKVGIFKKNIKLSEFSKPGDIVGEMSLILKRPRTATIKALTDCNILVIEGDLDDLVKQYPEMSKKLIKALAERLAAATEERVKL